jgi:long-chain acyl-CoA synthetase
MAAIEQELKVRFADDVAPQIYTLQDLLEGISQAKPGTSSPSLLSVSDRQAWTRLLASCPEDAVYSKHFLKAKPLLIPFFYVVMRGVYYLSKLLFRLRVSGLDQFPKESSFLICPNHLSYTDAFFLVSCLPYRVFRRLFFVGFSEYFGSRVTGFLGRLANVIPIDADTNLILAMRLAAEGLRHGKVLCIFPEGSRSIDGTLQEFRRGAAILAVEHQLPMMPVGLIGTYQVWPRDSLRIRLYPVAVKFGKPIKPLDGIPAQDSYPYDQITEQLRNAVAELISASPT